LAHASRLAEAVQLDMAGGGGGQQGSTSAAGGWRPTVESYLGRVTKARILQAVREAKGAPAAGRIAHLKKGEMAEQAQDLLAGSGWLPEPLRTPGQVATTAAAIAGAAAEQPADTVLAEADGQTEGPTEEATGEPVEDPTEGWRSAAD
jgi:ParB family chromosome partitioning protein